MVGGGLSSTVRRPDGHGEGETPGTQRNKPSAHARRGEPRSLLPLPLGSRSRSRVAPGRRASDGWRPPTAGASVRVLLGFSRAALCCLACGAAVRDDTAGVHDVAAYDASRPHTT